MTPKSRPGGLENKRRPAAASDRPAVPSLPEMIIGKPGILVAKMAD